MPICPAVGGETTAHANKDAEDGRRLKREEIGADDLLDRQSELQVK